MEHDRDCQMGCSFREKIILRQIFFQVLFLIQAVLFFRTLHVFEAKESREKFM